MVPDLQENLPHGRKEVETCPRRRESVRVFGNGKAGEESWKEDETKESKSSNYHYYYYNYPEREIRIERRKKRKKEEEKYCKHHYFFKKNVALLCVASDRLILIFFQGAPLAGFPSFFFLLFSCLLVAPSKYLGLRKRKKKSKSFICGSRLLINISRKAR